MELFGNAEYNNQKEIICSVCGKVMQLDSCGLEDGISYRDYICTCGNGATEEKQIWYE